MAQKEGRPRKRLPVMDSATEQLFSAVQRGDLEQVAQLLKHGANLGARDVSGRSALDYAGSDVMTDFLNSGGSLRSLDLHLIAAVRRGDMALAERLYSIGAGVNAVDAEGKTALMWAAERGDPVAIKALSSGSDVNVNLQDNSGNTALMMAASAGSLASVQALIESGADLNMQNKEGQTAMMKAAQGGHADSVCALIDAGADMNIQDNNGRTAMHHVARGITDEAGVDRVFESLEKRGESVFPLVAHQDNDGNNAMHHAGRQRNVAFMRRAMRDLTPEQRAEVMTAINKDGQNAFVAVMSAGDGKVAREILDKIPPEEHARLAQNYVENRDRLSAKDREATERVIDGLPEFRKLVDAAEVKPGREEELNAENSDASHVQDGSEETNKGNCVERLNLSGTRITDELKEEGKENSQQVNVSVAQSTASL